MHRLAQRINGLLSQGDMDRYQIAIANQLNFFEKWMMIKNLTESEDIEVII